MSAIIDSYGYTAGSTTSGIMYSGVRIGTGQSFEGDGRRLEKVSFIIYKEGAPTGNCYAKVYSHSGTYGTDSIPDSLLATSSGLDVSTLGGSTQSFTEFSFDESEKVTLEDGVYYVVTIEYSGGSSDNGVRWKGRQPSGHPGNKSEKSGSTGNWSATDYLDLFFYVYGTGPGVGVKYPLPAFKRP